ncbi:MAG: hypothetical protein AAF581_09475 [Planctomycetota bacterium]
MHPEPKHPEPMHPRAAAQCTVAPPSSAGGQHNTGGQRNDGIALFVVLIVGVILTVVIFQLTYTSKIEQRIADNRRGYLEVSYSMHSVARDVILRIYSDWKSDLDAADEDEAAASTPGMPGIPGTGTPGAANSSGSNTDPIDSRHEEDWAYPFQVQVNALELDVLVLDAEGRLNLNRIFDYVMVPGEDDGDTVSADPDAVLPGTGMQGGRDGGGDGADDDSDDAADDEDLLDEEEWEPPSEERELRTVEMLSWLVEGVIAANEEYGYAYDDLRNPDTVAEDIVRFVLERQENEETRRILRAESLVPIVGSELFFGPADPDAEEDEFDDEEFQQSSRYTGEDLGFGSEFFGEDGINPESGYEERDDLEAEDLGGPGVVWIPRPFGLRDVLTTYSAIKEPASPVPGADEKEYPALNLNTARAEVILALLRPDFDWDEGRDVAIQIENYLNTYAEEETEDAAGDLVADASTESSLDPYAEEEEEPIEFNVFRQLTDLREIDEEWSEDAEQIEAVNETVYTRLQKNLQKIAVFRSTYFTAYLNGKLEGHPLEGELVLERKEDDDENREVRVVYWREHLKR